MFPLEITPDRQGRDIDLSGQITIGICEDVCLPYELTLSAQLDASVSKPDPRIAAALASLPFSGSDAGIAPVRCEIAQSEQGLDLTAYFDLADRPVDAVVESSDPDIWVSEPAMEYRGATVIARTQLVHLNATSFALNRSGLTFTLIGDGQAYEFSGCS